MNKKETTEARRTLLLLEIKRVGLTALAQLAGKPVRQISDMAAGRKAFGDGVAKEIGPKIRPDLPREWLIYPENTENLHSQEESHSREGSQDSASLHALKPETVRDKRLKEILSVLEKTDDTGLAVVLHEAKKIADLYPIRIKETGS